MGDLSKHFNKSEFACKCGCGLADPAPELVLKLEEFRELCGNKPVNINSACRCAKHNAKVGGTKNSYHVKCMAADIKKMPHLTIDEMAKFAEQAGFRGIGKYNTFIHVDVRPTPARWDYRK